MTSRSSTDVDKILLTKTACFVSGLTRFKNKGREKVSNCDRCRLGYFPECKIFTSQGVERVSRCSAVGGSKTMCFHTLVFCTITTWLCWPDQAMCSDIAVSKQFCDLLGSDRRNDQLRHQYFRAVLQGATVVHYILFRRTRRQRKLFVL